MWGQREPQVFRPVLTETEAVWAAVEAEREDSGWCRGRMIEHKDGTEGGCELGEQCAGGEHPMGVECSSDWPPECQHCAALLCPGTETAHRANLATECSRGEHCTSRDWHTAEQSCAETYPDGCWYCDTDASAARDDMRAPRLVAPELL